MDDDLADQLDSCTRNGPPAGRSIAVAGTVPGRRTRCRIADLKVAEGRALPAGRSSFKTWWFGAIRFTAPGRNSAGSAPGKLSPFASGAGCRRRSPPPPRRNSKPELDEQGHPSREALRQLPSRQAEVLHLVLPKT